MSQRPYLFGAGSLIALITFAAPTRAEILHTGIRQINSGQSGFGSCAVLADSAISCWGNLSFAPSDPIHIDNQRTSTVAVGNGFFCALVEDGTVWCWGANNHGQLGDGTSTSRAIPQPVGQTSKASAMGNVVDLAVGDSHACAKRLIAGQTSVWCWGSNSKAQLGNFNVAEGSNFGLPIEVVIDDPKSGNPPLSNIETITLGDNFSCAQLNDETAACWGDNTFGQLGNNLDLETRNSPQTVLIPSQMFPGLYEPATFVLGSLHAGGEHVCALTFEGATENAAACWGRDLEGQVGDGNSGSGPDGDGDVLLPTAVVFPDGAKLKNLYEVLGGGRFSCGFLEQDSSAACWGEGDSGQLGNGYSDAVSPLPVVDKDDAKIGNLIELTTGYSHACDLTYGAIYTDRTISCWGDNGLGQLGNHAMTKSRVPVEVPVDATLFVDGFDGR